MKLSRVEVGPHWIIHICPSFDNESIIMGLLAEMPSTAHRLTCFPAQYLEPIFHLDPQESFVFRHNQNDSTGGTGYSISLRQKKKQVSQFFFLPAKTTARLKPCNPKLSFFVKVSLSYLRDYSVRGNNLIFIVLRNKQMFPINSAKPAVIIF